MDDKQLQRYLENIRKIRYPLARRKELELAERISRGEKIATTTLGEAYAKLAAELAEDYYAHEGWRGISQKAFIQEANTGLFLAASRYGRKENNKHPFTDFARRYIKNSLDQLVDKHRIAS